MAVRDVLTVAVLSSLAIGCRGFLGGRRASQKPVFSGRRVGVRRLVPLASGNMDTEDVRASIDWLPPLNPSAKDVEVAEGAQVLPMFPLGAVAYCPESEQTLNIFEPRYRSMYNDILMNGSRRFVVTMANNEQAGQFAEVGVVFYLSDLKEVSEQTQDQIKYICQHKVLERVRIKRVINPRVAADRSTYMRCEIGELKDYDENDDLSAAEGIVMDKLQRVVDLQTELNEEVRFSEDVMQLFNATRTGEGGLWSLIELWKSFLQSRMQAKSSQMQRDVQQKLVDYLQERAKKSSEAEKSMRDATFSLADLPPNLRKEVSTMQDRLREEVMPMLDEQTLWVQLLLQMNSHADRLATFGIMMESETKRLETKVALKNTFGGGISFSDQDSLFRDPEDFEDDVTDAST